MQQLISVSELQAELGARDLVVVDCRFNLLEPGSGRQAWQAGHIPGAFYAHLDEDLAGIVRPESGRHPLPETEDFGALLGAWGVTPESRVVVYDDAGGAIAARLWWLLGWAGHEQAALLDGGLPAWVSAGFPLDTSVPEPKTGIYPLTPGCLGVMTASQVQTGLHQDHLALLDARDAARFAGEIEPIDPRAGHVPGALNRPFQANLDEQGCFLSPEQLQAEFSQLLKGHKQQPVACMCGSGVTACHHVFAMQLAGLEIQPFLYVGSWSEWIRDPDRPCEPD